MEKNVERNPHNVYVPHCHTHTHSPFTPYVLEINNVFFAFSKTKKTVRHTQQVPHCVSYTPPLAIGFGLQPKNKNTHTKLSKTNYKRKRLFLCALGISNCDGHRIVQWGQCVRVSAPSVIKLFTFTKQNKNT